MRVALKERSLDTWSLARLERFRYEINSCRYRLLNHGFDSLNKSLSYGTHNGFMTLFTPMDKEEEVDHADD